MTKDKAIALAQGQLDAYNQRDLEKFCAHYHPEVIVTNLLTGEVTQGMALFTPRYRQLFSSSPQLHCELKSRTVLESSVIDEEHVTGITQLPQGLHAVAIYAFRDNLIDRVWFTR